MKLPPFALERYFARHEFTAKYLLSSSDCDGWRQSDVLALADDETRRLWDALSLGYTESRGLPLLRREIAKLYRGFGEDDVMTAAPQEAILIAMSCLLEKGDRVVCGYPGYQSLYQLAESLGCAVDRWQPDERRGWLFNLDELEAMLKPDTKLVVVNFPHNPTGALPSKADFQRLLQLCRERGLHLFSDEMYRLLELDEADRLPPACELYDKAISLSGMSKAFGMAGARIGWLATKDKALYKRMTAYRDYTTICSASPSEILALIGLRAKDVVLAKHLARLRRNLGLLDEFFARQEGFFRWTRPKAGTVGFARLLEEPDALNLCERLVAETGVLLLPSTVYAFGNAHVRFGFGRENMPEALEKLEAWLDRRA